MSGTVQQQFELPRGILGHIAGWWMTRENARMNRAAIGVLGVRPGDDVLEIGFGPGEAIELLVQQTPARRIAGVDPSEVMVDAAVERNAAAIASGRVTLAQGSVEELPMRDGAFSKVFAVNNFSLWDSPERGLDEIWRVLRAGGRLVVCLRRAARPHFWTSPGLSPAELEDCRRMIARHGFRDVRSFHGRSGTRIVSLVGVRAG